MKKVISAALTVFVLTGCASGLNSSQKREYESFKQNNVLVEEKSPGAGAMLGLLPGGGSFYAREPGFGAVNLLLWPLSILWDPVSGHEGSKVINYDITKRKLRSEKTKEISILEDNFMLNEIDNAAYVSEKRKIEQKYDHE